MDRDTITAHLRRSSEVKLALIPHVEVIEEFVSALAGVVKAGGCIYSCGNGGSACDAIHLTEELVARYQRERPGIRAAHLCEAAVLTCWSNDYDFASVFERQVDTHVSTQDALLVFSTSGNSENILRALAAANRKQALTLALLGRGGGKAKSLARRCLIVPSDVTAHIQEAHIAVVHIICDLLEQRLFPAP